jgi:hypothetical protein
MFRMIDREAYLGDTVLRLLALRKRSENPHSWYQDFATNRHLAKIYDWISLTSLPRVIGKRWEKVYHQKASIVESWLGEIYEESGQDIAVVEQFWDYMHDLKIELGKAHDNQMCRLPTREVFFNL